MYKTDENVHRIPKSFFFKRDPTFDRVVVDYASNYQHSL